jgi:hypothetical protein
LHDAIVVREEIERFIFVAIAFRAKCAIGARPGYRICWEERG